MASIDIEGTTTIVCGSWLNRSIDFHNGTSFFCKRSNSVCESGTDEFIFRSPKVFADKCAKRKVERVVAWLAVALARAADRVESRAAWSPVISPLGDYLGRHLRSHN